MNRKDPQVFHSQTGKIHPHLHLLLDQQKDMQEVPLWIWTALERQREPPPLMQPLWNQLYLQECPLAWRLEE